MSCALLGFSKSSSSPFDCPGDCVVLQAFKLHGLEKINPVGESFDPNQHEAMFEAEDPSKDPGTVIQVLKVLCRHSLRKFCLFPTAPHLPDAVAR